MASGGVTDVPINGQDLKKRTADEGPFSGSPKTGARPWRAPSQSTPCCRARREVTRTSAN